MKGFEFSLLHSKHWAVIGSERRGLRSQIGQCLQHKDPREGKELAQGHRAGRGRGQTNYESTDSSPSAFYHYRASFFLPASVLLFFENAKQSPKAIVSFVHVNKKHKEPRVILMSRLWKPPD